MAGRGARLWLDDFSLEILKLMEALPQTRLYTGKFLALIQEGHWEYVDRLNATGAVLLVAVSEAQKVLLVEQYRIPIHARTIELPAGLIGDDSGSAKESALAAARRELLEETGYAAGQLEQLTHGPACSGMGTEISTFFYATKLQRIGAGGGVAREAITVHEVPLTEVHAWLEARARSGVMIDPKVYAGLYFILRR